MWRLELTSSSELGKKHRTIVEDDTSRGVLLFIFAICFHLVPSGIFHEIIIPCSNVQLCKKIITSRRKKILDIHEST
jgi:hypothetical protein